MGKSSKKSNAQIAAPGVTFEKSGKKGKRNAEDALENQSLKKQKKEVEEALLGGKKTKKAAPAPPPKKKPVSSSSSEEDSSDEKTVKKNVAPAKKAAPSVKKQESSSSEEDSSSDEEFAGKHAPPAKKVVPPKKQESSSSEEDSSSDEEPEKKPAAIAKKPTLPQVKKHEASSSEEDISSDSSDENLAKKPVAKINKKSSNSSKQQESSSSEEVSDEEKAAVKNVESDDESEDDSSDKSDDKPQAKKQKSLSTTANKIEKKDSSDEDDNLEESSSGSEEEKPTKTPQKVKDVVMKDAQLGVKSPVTQMKDLGSKTLFCANLSFNADKDSVMEFFQEAGEVINVHLSHYDDGKPKGFGHVEFATEDGVRKALEMNGQEFMGREVKVDLARGRGAQTPYSGRENNSFQKGDRTQGLTIFVKGFDKFQEEEQIRSSLENFFKDCGEISRISLPKDYESGSFKGMCYMDFKNKDAYNKALQLNGQYIGDYSIVVDEAKPRADSGGGYSGGRGDRSGGGRGDRGRSGGRRGGRDGGFGGRGRGGRDGRGRGRGGGRPSMGTPGTGKKTTFGDD